MTLGHPIETVRLLLAALAVVLAVPAALAQVPYEGATEGLLRWQFAPDPPLRHIGDTWFIVPLWEG